MTVKMVVTGGNVNDFDLMGVSHYPELHTTVGIDQISEHLG